MADRPDIVTDIWTAATAAHPVTDTAEQRAAIDAFMRTRLQRIEDPSIRAHAAEMIKFRRWKLFGLPACPTCGEDVRRAAPVEITTLRPKA